MTGLLSALTPLVCLLMGHVWVYSPLPPPAEPDPTTAYLCLRGMHRGDPFLPPDRGTP
jgi:hypothetical protein